MIGGGITSFGMRDEAAAMRWRSSLAPIFVVLGTVALLLGAAFYLAARPNLPWALLSLRSQAPLIDATNDAWNSSLPSGLHAFAFTCLLGGCWSFRSALLWSGGIWFTMNLSWEVVCHAAFPWQSIRQEIVAFALLMPGAKGECTFDYMDIVAAGIGALLPVTLQFLATSFQRPLAR